jgi:uncharacterized protein (TIGR03435 family)
MLNTRAWVVVLMFAAASVGNAQTAAAKLEFDVASIKQNKSDDRPYSNFPIGPGAMYVPNGGHFSARGLPLSIYIMFAYKMTDHEVESMMKQLPGWAKDDRYDIEAKTENANATKDEMRLMMQSLLADRAKLAVHVSSEEVSVYDLVLVKPGKLGPKLRLHPADDPSCSNAPPAPAAGAPPPQTLADGFPVICGGLAGFPGSAPGRLALGYRNVSLKLIALQMTGFGGLDRPVIDQTGLVGNYDFVIEFTPERAPDAAPRPDVEEGPTFRQALADQTGLKLVPQKGSVEIIVIDHIERPSAN